MQTLQYGFLLPQTGDKGSTMWNALSGNITQLNNHTHDGVTSAPIVGSNIATTQQVISNSNWTAYGGPIGFFRQVITMAAGYLFDTDTVSFRTDQGAYAYPTVERISATTFFVYTTDPSINLVAMYGG